MSTDGRRRPTAHARRRPRRAAHATAPRTTSSSPSCPSRSTSSTPPCATAASRKGSRSPSTTSCGWPSSSTTSGSPSSRAGGPAPTPRTRSSSPGPRPSSHSRPATLVAFGSTRRAGVRAEDDETLRHLVERRAPRRSASWPSRPRSHVTEALRTTLDEAVAMVADSVALPARPRPPGLPRRRALLRRLPGAIPTSPCRSCAAAEEAGAEALVLCDTNGGTLPDEVERIVADVRGRIRDARSASTSTTTPAAPWPTRWPPCRPGPPRSRAASTATASGPATPTCPPPSPTCR